jgi:hypothetical protein
MYVSCLAGVLLALAGCQTSGAQDSACTEAAAYVEACTGEAVPLDGCDTGVAEAVLSASCDDLTESGGKADCAAWSWWTNMECWAGAGDADSRGEGITATIRVDYCADDLEPCIGVTSATCTRVDLVPRGGGDVVTQYTGQHGSARFTGLREGAAYEARVYRRDGSLARCLECGSSQRSAASITPGASGAEVTFTLHPDERAQTYACADVVVPIDVVAGGEALSAEELEWDWIAVYQTPAGREQSRLYRDDELGSSALVITQLRPGALEIALWRVAVPATETCSWGYDGDRIVLRDDRCSWGCDDCRLPNRNEELLEHFALGDQPVARFGVRVTEPEIERGERVVADAIEVVDPYPGR